MAFPNFFENTKRDNVVNINDITFLLFSTQR